MADVNANIGINIDSASAIAELKSLQRQISQFHTSIAKSSATAATAQAGLQKNLLNTVNAIGAFSASMVNVKTTSQAFTDSLEKNKFSMREYFRYATASTKSFGKLFKTEYDTIGKVAEERVKRLQTQYIKMGQSANGVLQAMAITPKELDMSNLTTQMALASQKQQLFNQLVRQGSTNLLNFGKNTQWAGRQLMVGFTLPLMALGSTSSQVFMDMEAQVLKFKKVYGDLFTPQEETQAALANVKELANSFTQYGIAASKTVGLAAEAAAAGFKGIDLQAQTREATRLSVLGQIEQQQALETTIALQNAFNVSATDLADNINFLNAVENQTVTSLDDITIAIPKVAPVIQQLGGDVKDLAFFLTAMKEGGVNASEGANALKSGLASLINPTKKASDMLKTVGIDMAGIVQKNKGDLKQTVIDFAKALDTLDPLSRARAIEQLFGKFQFARVSTLFQNVIKDGSQASRVLDLATASASDLANTADKELGMTAESSMMKFKKAVEDLKVTLIPVGQTFLQAVTPIVEFVGKLLEKFNNLGDGSKKAIALIVGVVGGLGPVLLMTFGLLANGLANIIKLFLTLRGGYKRLTDQSQILGEQTQYMTMEQIDAAAAAHSLDQIHAQLTQQFTAEAVAVKALRDAYMSAARAGERFASVNPGMMMPKPRGKFAQGGIVRGKGTGTSDSVPIMASDGEAVIPAKRVKEYGPLIQGIISGSIPKFATGTMNVSGRSVPMNFNNPAALGGIQQIINKILEGGSGLQNAEEIIAETLMRLSKDTSVSLRSFLKELDIVTMEMEKVQLPESIVGERKYSAKKAGITATIEQQMMSRGAAGAEEVARANVAAQAVYEEYQKLGVTGRKLEQALQVDRAHIIEVTNADKRFKEAWQENVFLVQSHAENELSQSLTYAKNQQAYLSVLKKVDATEQEKAVLADKVRRNLALTEEELQLQAKVLQEMLGDTALMKTTSQNFGTTAKGVVAAARARQKMGPASTGVGSRTQYEMIAGQQALATAKYRGEMAFMKQLETDATNAVDRLIVAMARKAQTQSPSRRTIQIGKDIIKGLVVGMKGGEAELQAEAGKVSDIATLSKQKLYGGGPVSAIDKSIRRQQEKRTRMSDLGGAMAIGAATQRAAQDQAAKLKLSAERLDSFNGKLMGGMFALTSLSGVVSMAGGNLGKFGDLIFQISGPLFALSSILQLFTGEKIISLISKFKFGFGLASAALVAGVVALKLINNAREKERLAIEGVGKAANLTADQLKKLGDIYGFTPTKSPLSTAKPTVAVNPVQRGRIEETKKLMASDKDFQFNVKALKKASQDQANIIFRGMAVKLAGSGASEDAIKEIIVALQEEAGRTDLKVDFKALTLKTKEGQTGLKKQAQALTKAFSNEFDKGYTKSTMTFAARGYSATQSVEILSKKLKQVASTTANSFAGILDGISNGFANGTINAQEFSQSFDSISNSINNMPQPQAMYLMQQILKTLPSDLAKSAQNIKNVSDQLLILKAASLGVAVSAAAIDALAAASAPGADPRAQLGAGRIRASIKKQIADRMKVVESIIKDFNKGTTTLPGGAGEDPDWIKAKKQLEQTRTEAKNTAKSYGLLKKMGVETGRALEISKDPTLAAGIVEAAKKGGKAWTTIRNLVKETNDLLLNGALKEFFESRTSGLELKKNFNAIVPQLVNMGLDLENIQAILDNPDLARAFINDLKDGKLDAQKLKTYIDQIPEEKRIKLQFDLSTPEGVDQAFSNLKSKAGEYFDILERTARDRFADQIKAGEAAVAAAEKDVQIVQDKIDGIQTKINNKQREIEMQINRPIAQLQDDIDSLQRQIELQYTRPINALQDESARLSEELTVMDHAAEAINKKYDDQEAALTRIADINQQIIEQQGKQLNLAGALSQGDISAAAQAAQDMRASMASAQSAGTMNALKAAREAEIGGLRSASGLTRDQITQRQYEIERQIFSLNQQAAVVQAQILAKQDEIYKLEQSRKPLLADIQKFEDEIYNIQNGELKTAQDRLINAQASLQAVKDKLQAELDSIDAQRRLWEQAQLAIDNAKIKAGQFDDVIKATQGKIADIVDMWNNQIKDKNVTLTITEIRNVIVNTIQGSGGGDSSGSSGGDSSGSSGGGSGAPHGAVAAMYGGWIKKMAVGGTVPGSGYGDKIPALLTPGEFVVNKASAQAYAPLLSSINESLYPSMSGMGTDFNSIATVSTIMDNSSTLYNYNLGFNINGTNANPRELANAIMVEIKRMESQRIRNKI